MVARLGGDEFVVLVRDANELSVVEKILRVCRKKYSSH